MKQIRLTVALILPALLSAAQTAVTDAGNEARPVSPFPAILEDPMFYFWILLIGVLLIVLFTLVHSIQVLSRALVRETGTQTAVVAETVKRKTTWHKLMDVLTRSVPVEQERDVLLDHDYDGIRELDNKLPPWWVWGFYLTIVYAFVYIFYFHFSGSGKLMAAEYQEELNIAAFEKEKRIRLDANYVTAENVAKLTDPAAIGEGAATFQKLCLACHGDKGQGNVGPNLTDAYWLHGGGIKNIFQAINEGIPSKGMIAWKAQLSPRQIQEVSSFIMTLEGTKPAGAKDPQGDLYVEVTDSAGTATASPDSVTADTLDAKSM